MEAIRYLPFEIGIISIIRLSNNFTVFTFSYVEMLLLNNGVKISYISFPSSSVSNPKSFNSKLFSKNFSLHYNLS